MQERGSKYQTLLHTMGIAFRHLIDEFGQAEILNFTGDAGGAAHLTASSTSLVGLDLIREIGSGNERD